MTHPDRDPRLRDGQPALGREGARARRRHRDDQRRRRRGPRRRRPDPARRRRLPAGDGADPRARPRRADRRAPRRRGADPRHLPRHAAALRLDHRARRGRRPRPARRARSTSSTPTGLKVPHIGWAPVRWERESRLAEGIDPRPPSTSSTPSRPRPAPGELLGSADYGARFACAAERDNVFGVQFHPEKSSAAGLRLLSNFAGICARPAPGVILYPGDRHPRRPGGAAAAGRLRARDRLRRRPGRRGRALGRRRGRVPARRRPRRRQGGRAAEPRGVRRIAAAVACPIQVGGGLRDADRGRRAARGRRRRGS